MANSVAEQHQLHFVQGLEAIVTLTERQDFPKEISATNINTYLSSLEEKEPMFYQVFHNDMRAYAQSFHEKVQDYKSSLPKGKIQRALYTAAVIPASLAMEIGNGIQKISVGSIPTSLGAALCMAAAGMMTFKMEEGYYILAKLSQLYLIGSLGAFCLPMYMHRRNQLRSYSDFSYFLEDRMENAWSPKHRVLADYVLHHFQTKISQELTTPLEIEKRKALEKDLQLFSIGR